MFDLFRIRGPRKGTGMWPLVNPRPWDLRPEAGMAVIIDPVAVSQEAALELRKVEWPGISLMDDTFQMSLLESDANVDKMAEAWFEQNRGLVADEIERRVSNYDADRVSHSARMAVSEASAAYSAGNFLTVVRVILPEFEAVARTLVTKRSSKAAVDGLLLLLRDTPMIREDPIETMSMYEFIDGQLFASCKDEAHAQVRGNAPNRHAETHALRSYGNLRGASFMICGIDLLLRLATRHLDLGYEIPSAAR